MDWDKLRVFHAVADAGSLTHAGEQLHLSQSAISRQIRGLEEQLQSVLFHRHARGLLLTEQGELLYEATLSMSKRLNAAAARIRDSKDEVHGDLRVTATAGFGTLWLAPRLHKLFDTHPDFEGWDIFQALLPMASEEDLSRALGGATRGTAWFSSELDHYEELREPLKTETAH